MSEIQNRLATLEIKSAIGKNLPSGWLSFIAPLKSIGAREEFYGHLAEFVRDFRTDAWPANDNLLDERFNGNFYTAKAAIKARFSTGKQLEEELSGQGPHILATSALVYAPGFSTNTIQDLHPDNVEAMQLVAVDISGPEWKRQLKHASNISRLGPDRLKHSTYTSLFGGVEARYDIDDSLYFNIASESLHAVTRGFLKNRTQTLYLANENIDSRAINTYADLGFLEYGDAPEDETYGPIKIYRRILSQD